MSTPPQPPSYRRIINTEQFPLTPPTDVRDCQWNRQLDQWRCNGGQWGCIGRDGTVRRNEAATKTKEGARRLQYPAGPQAGGQRRHRGMLREIPRQEVGRCVPRLTLGFTPQIDQLPSSWPRSIGTDIFLNFCDLHDLHQRCR